jgi:UDP-N-acetylglucosamine--N-acetylmuramyl-(pentapeptide) pyrophosphoryl-undecaprenol N-acetylglucosamine transferase
LPAILVPFPEAADNHQVFNARFFEQQGGGFVLEQGFVGDLAREVLEVMANEWLLRQFRYNLQRLDRDDAAEFIATDLERLLRDHPVAVRAREAVTA